MYWCLGKVGVVYLLGGENEVATVLRNDFGDDAAHEQGLVTGQGIFDAYIV